MHCAVLKDVYVPIETGALTYNRWSHELTLSAHNVGLVGCTVIAVSNLKTIDVCH